MTDAAEALAAENTVVFLFPPAQIGGKHEPTDQSRAIVHRAAGLGLTREQIAVLMGIGPTILNKHYHYELTTAVAFLNFNVANNLYSMAINQNHPHSARSAMFWMKTRAGWRETTRHEHVGEGGGPVRHEIRAADTIDVRTLSPDDREALKQTLVEALAQQLGPPIEGDFIEVSDEYETEEDREEDADTAHEG